MNLEILKIYQDAPCMYQKPKPSFTFLLLQGWITSALLVALLRDGYMMSRMCLSLTSHYRLEGLISLEPLHGTE